MDVSLMEDKYNAIIGMDKPTTKKMPHLGNYNNKDYRNSQMSFKTKGRQPLKR
jgi:hypothetical protein